MDEYFHGERRDLKSLKQKLRQQKQKLRQRTTSPTSKYMYANLPTTLVLSFNHLTTLSIVQTPYTSTLYLYTEGWKQKRF